MFRKDVTCEACYGDASRPYPRPAAIDPVIETLQVDPERREPA